MYTYHEPGLLLYNYYKARLSDSFDVTEFLRPTHQGLVMRFYVIFAHAGTGGSMNTFELDAPR